MPKCLVEVGGEPLLERALRGLATKGVAEAIIVVGYKGQAVRDHIGSRFADVDIRYVDAPDFDTTNNIRSLWDARKYLDEDVLLLEADVAFDPDVIAALVAVPGTSAVAGNVWGVGSALFCCGSRILRVDTWSRRKHGWQGSGS